MLIVKLKDNYFNSLSNETKLELINDGFVGLFSARLIKSEFGIV